MRIYQMLLLFFMLLGVNIVVAQQPLKSRYSAENRHQIRLSYSDGLPSSSSDLLGFGIIDALTGTERSDIHGSGVLGIGYRYTISRVRIGGDIAFSSIKSELSFMKEKSPSLKEQQLSFMILPTFEFIYYKKGIIELYGSGASGVDLSRTSYKKIKNTSITNVPSSDLVTSFAWQINPIALKLGNDRIGGFLELGLGYRGFLTGGVSISI